MPAYTHPHHCSLFKTGEVKINYVRTFDQCLVTCGGIVVGYFHGFYKENHVYRSTRAVLLLSNHLSTCVEF